MQKKETYELTSPQKSIWITEQFYKESNINTLCATFFIKEKVDFQNLEKAINIVVEENDALRLRVILTNGNIEQYISEYIEIKNNLVELEKEEEVHLLENKIAQETFNINNSQLFIFTMFKLPNGHGGVILKLHHLIGDSWSLGITGNKIAETYSYLLKNKKIEIKNNSYIEYINSESMYLKSEKIKKDKEFWNNIYSTIPEIATIPYTNKNLIINSIKANRITKKINKDLLMEINEFCSKNKISMFNFFMAVYSIYIYKITNIDDFVIGTPILNRTNFREKDTIGMFANTLPYRIKINSELTIEEFLKQLTIDSISMLRHQKYSYQSILKDLRKKDSNIPKLYKILISYQITKITKANNILPYETTWNFNNSICNDIDIHISDITGTGNIDISYDYNLEKYQEKVINEMHERVINIIENIIENPKQKIKNIEIISFKEKRQIKKINNTKEYIDLTKNIQDIFEEKVIEKKDKIAIKYKNIKISYFQLNNNANKIANFLVKNNIKQKDVIVITMKRSIEMLETILGVIKSGAIYFLIDDSLPEERKKYILNNSKAKMIIIDDSIDKKYIEKDSENKEKIKKITDIKLLEKNTKNPNIQSSSEDVACLIYTSGSTGMPKGIELRRKGILNLVSSFKKHLNIEICNQFISISTISFDMFMVEIFLPLLTGKTLILASEEEYKYPTEIARLIKQNNVQFILTTPSRMELLLDNRLKECLKNVEVIQLGGEVFKPQVFRKLREATKAIISNGYGPSEFTACCLNKIIENENKISIGTPFCNTQVYILNKDMNICPRGIEGEIYISGYGEAKGYVDNEKMTKEYFFPNPFGEGRIYKTGDIGLINEFNEIEYTGRKDFQVKLRGLRIETLEIEKDIMLFPEVDKTVVVYNQENDCLVAFYTEKKPISKEKINKKLMKTLPVYMIPKYFILLDKFPMNYNGKIDRKFLENYKIEVKSKAIYEKPENCNQKILCEIWEKILNKKIGINDNIFEIGADSLSIIKFKTELSMYNLEITYKQVFYSKTIKEMSKHLTNIKNKIGSNLRDENIENDIKIGLASYAQRRIYFASKTTNECNIMYNIPGVIVFDQEPDSKKLEECFKKLIELQESLRTCFELKNGELFQKVMNNIEFKLNIESSEQSIEQIYETFVKPFELEKAPLFRVKLVKIKDGKTLFLVDIHHIISDGTSIKIMLEQLSKLYNGEKIKNMGIQYIDYTDIERKKIEENKKIEEYWMNKFEGNIPVLNMPTVYNRPNVQSYKGENYYTIIDSKLKNDIERISINNNITPYILMLSALYITLYKYTGQKDIIIGTPTEGRTLQEIQEMIGMFVNTLPIKAEIKSDMKILSFLEYIKEQCIENIEYQEYPIEKIIKKLKIKRDTSRNPLFDIMFIYQNNGIPQINLKNINSYGYYINNKISKFDLSLEIIPEKEKINVRIEYSIDLFDEKYIKQFFNCYLNSINYICLNLQNKIEQVEIISQEEKNKIINEFNNTNGYYREDAIINRFEENVMKNPNDVALIYEDYTITYDELNKKANRVANYLLKNGIKESDIITILMDRSPEVIISMIAILKIGAAFLLVDPTYPEDRIKYYIKNSKSRIILKQRNIEELNNAINIEDVFENEKNEFNVNKTIDIDKIAYIIYTSGSTGIPKGVLLTGRNLSNLYEAMKQKFEYLNYGNKYTVASDVTIAFDFFIFETLISLTCGLKLVLIDYEGQKNPIKFQEIILKDKIDIIQTTPSVIKMYFENRTIDEAFKRLKYIIFGGENLPYKLVKDIKKVTQATIYNGYGPTETTVFTSIDKIEDDYITIGKPILNTRIYILDKDKKMCPLGIEGEIYITGECVGNGYLNQPELTNQKFINLPYEKTKFYKTGDLGKWNELGKIEFKGRIDDQVKIRGLRIELGEIENNILLYPDISDCAVIKKVLDDGNEVLCAYYVEKKIINVNKLRKQLKNKLPDYMLPQYFIKIDKIPHTLNGKIDKKELQNYNINFINTDKVTEPSTEMEKKFCQIFEKILGKTIGIDDDLFEIGIDSLTAIKFKIEALSYGIDVEYADIFKNKTIRKIAENIGKNNVIRKYDQSEFYNINKVLNKNTLNTLIHADIKEKNNNNIMLFGSNGYVGAHILYKFIKYDKGKVYCVIRDKKSESAEDRFLEIMHFYFENELDKYINDRIFIIKGEFTEERFGLSEEKYNHILSDIQVIINSAAMVKHYGQMEKFRNINIQSTERIANLCMENNKKLIHISTMSVAGDTNIYELYVEQQRKEGAMFSESTLYEGQELENNYIRTKFEAEKLILDKINQGLDAKIIRLGNMTNRYEDGKFQINPDGNAFVNRIRSFIEIKAIPDYIKNLYLEFTPVDCAAEAIVKIVQNDIHDFTIFHIQNDKNIMLQDFVKKLNEHNIEIKFIDKDSFSKIVHELIKSENEECLSGIINDIDKDGKLIYRDSNSTTAELTKYYLLKVGYIWPRVDENYINRYIEYMKKICFFK